MRLYFEAVTKLRKQMMPPLQNAQIVRGTLKAYLRSLDPYSDYLSPEEFKQYKLLQGPQYAGVGMDIDQEKAGRIVCFPYPESPAMKAGIEAGDVLEAVDGVSTADLSLFTVGLKVRGQEGTTVRLKVAKVHGGQKDVQIIRTAFEVKSVLVETQGSLPVVRLLTFTPRTSQELQNALSTLGTTTAVVLDLRGNTGGTLLGAINAAKLFLARGQKIADIKTQEGLKEYRNDLDATAPPLQRCTSGKMPGRPARQKSSLRPSARINGRLPLARPPLAKAYSRIRLRLPMALRSISPPATYTLRTGPSIINRGSSQPTLLTLGQSQPPIMLPKLWP